jgi:hypothetical protein
MIFVSVLVFLIFSMLTLFELAWSEWRRIQAHVKGLDAEALAGAKSSVMQGAKISKLNMVLAGVKGGVSFALALALYNAIASAH